MKVLVIGASGFIGRHVWWRLESAGMSVSTATRRELTGSSRHEQIDLGGDSVERTVGVLDATCPDVVVNCSGYVGSDIATLSQTNVDGVATLVRAMMHRKSGARLVHLGSAAEYGRTAPGSSVSENAPARPLTPYGMSKLAGTRIVQTARSAGLDAVVLRVTNPVGPGAPETSVSGRLVAEIARSVREGDAVRLGPVGSWRDFVDVRDVATAVHSVISDAALLPSTLNVGSGRAIVVKELVDAMIEASGYSGTVESNADGSGRSSSTPWQQADISTIRQVLGWSPLFDLQASMRDQWSADR